MPPVILSNYRSDTVLKKYRKCYCKLFSYWELIPQNIQKQFLNVMIPDSAIYEKWFTFNA